MKLRAIALGLAISIPIANAYVTGDLTYYTPGQGSCGITNQNGDAIVALSISIMQLDDGANPNANPICNKQISIHNPTTGTDTIATVTDSCEGCAFGSIDVPPDLFKTIAPNGDGRVHGIEWTPIGWTVPGGSGEAQSSASPVVQPSSSSAPAAAAVPSPSPVVVAAQASTPSVVVPAVPSAAAASSSPAQQPSSAPTASTASCTTAGDSVCSADGTQIGTCTTELSVQFMPVAEGTKCVGGYMVMANSRLRSRRD